MRRATTVPVALAFLSLFSTDAHAAEPRAGVVVIGADPAAVDEAQRTFESRLSSSSITVRGLDDLAPVIGAAPAAVPNAWSSDAAARAGFDAAMSEVKKAYFSDSMPTASQRLDAAAAILEKTVDAPGAVRVRVPFWRAAVLLRQGQKEDAESELRLALVMVPTMDAEPNAPPPVVQLLQETRAKLPKPFRVTLTGSIPANSIVKIDDVVLGAANLAATSGTHVLDVIAPGYRPFNRAFDADGDTTIEVALVPALGAAWERLFEGIVARGDVADGERRSLDSLAQREKLDYLVLASTKSTESRALVWRRRDGKSQSQVGADAETLAAWAVQQIGGRAVASATPRSTPRPSATPRPVATPLAGGGGGEPAGMTVALEAGFAFAQWTRTVDSKAPGNDYDVPGLGGGGPRVRASLLRGAVHGDLEASYVSFGSIETTAPDQSDATVPGGSMLAARVSAGYRHLLGARDEESPWVTLLLGGFYESYTAGELEDAKHVFPSHVRSGLDVRMAASIPAGPVRLLLEGGAQPVGSWAETPADSTGEDPIAGVNPLWRLGASLAVGSKGQLALEYAGSQRSVAFTDAGKSEIGAVDATRSEMLHVLGASYRFRF